MNHSLDEIQDNVDSLVELIGLNSLTLASEDGLVIAGCGPALDVEMMAAVSPLLHQGDESASHYQEELQEQGLDLNVLDFKLEDQSLFLCATGATSQIHHPELHNLLQQIIRTLRI